MSLKTINYIGVLSLESRGIIGRGSNIFERIPEDLSYLKTLVKNQVVVMGSNTWNDVADFKWVRDCTVVVLTRKDKRRLKNPHWVKAVSDYSRLKMTLTELTQEPELDVYVLGGATAYSLLSRNISYWMVTGYDSNQTDLSDVVYLDTLTLDSIYSGKLICKADKQPTLSKSTHDDISVGYFLYESKLTYPTLKTRRRVVEALRKANPRLFKWQSFISRFFK